MARQWAKQGPKQGAEQEAGHGADQGADRGANGGANRGAKPAATPGSQPPKARADAEDTTLDVTRASTLGPTGLGPTGLGPTGLGPTGLAPTAVATLAQTAVGGAGRVASRVITLKRRSEFLRVRKGARCARPAFVLEAKVRDVKDRMAAVEGARFGFTVTRQVGKAVERNRIRRRLKAAIAAAAGGHAKRDFDYVLIARRAALALPFDALVTDLIAALDRIHRSIPQRGRHKETGSKLAG
jgi:ribonuclease P protein component